MNWIIRYPRHVRSLSCEELEIRRCLSAVVFQSHAIPAITGSPVAADIDGDGDVDLVADDGWYRNMGAGTFGQRKEIGSDLGAVTAADFDGDEDLDILSAFTWFDREFFGTLAWYENVDGRGNFERHDISNDYSKVSAGPAADIDGDGDLDFVSAKSRLGRLWWYENTDGLGAFVEREAIATDVYRINTINLGDVDGDGDIDVLSTSDVDGNATWYANDGNGIFVPRTVLGTSVLGCCAEQGAGTIQIADIDGDGDGDLVASSEGFISVEIGMGWMENLDGNGTFGPLHPIHIPTAFGDWGADSIRIVDFDGDGDLDIASASRRLGKISWYENVDGKGRFADEHVISIVGDGRSGTGVYIADTVDLDGDGDIDILSARYRPITITWLENRGEGVLPGDSNGDSQFNQFDIVQVLQAAKYLTGNQASFSDGDWNLDGRFDQLDIVFALQEGDYRPNL